MSRLDLPDDFRDLLVALADASAEFVLIGGWAMAVHGRLRATEDLDVLVRATPANARFDITASAHRGRAGDVLAGAAFGAGGWLARPLALGANLRGEIGRNAG